MLREVGASPAFEDAVVALGGGAAADDAASRILSGLGVRLFLDVPVDRALERIADGEARPMLGNDDRASRWQRLRRQRLDHYRRCDATIDAGGSADEVVSSLVDAVARLAAPEWEVDASIEGAPSQVTCYRSAYVAFEHAAGQLPAGDSHILVDERVEDLYYPMFERVAGARQARTTIEAAEGAKNFDLVERTISRIAERGITRSGALLGVGGGITTDVTGLLASLYMRGIDAQYLPTTLLAQIDASIGGKCGVNAAGARNLVGAFHLPRTVTISPGFLHTLPARELRTGIVEGVKMGIIHDPALLPLAREVREQLAAGLISDTTVEFIRRCVQLKVEVVRSDLRDHGSRVSLNFGHTYAHALEAAGPDRYTHGESVALGMLAVTVLAVELEAVPTPRMREVASDVAPFLPAVDSMPSGAQLVSLMRHDKKRTTRGVLFVIPGDRSGYSVMQLDDPGRIARAWDRAVAIASTLSESPTPESVGW